MLSTAGKLLFAGDGSGNLVALDATNGNPLWHANLGSSVSNGPITYELDGTQYLVVAAGDSLFGFAMLRVERGVVFQFFPAAWYILFLGMLDGKKLRRWARSFVAASLAALFSLLSWRL